MENTWTQVSKELDHQDAKDGILLLRSTLMDALALCSLSPPKFHFFYFFSPAEKFPVFLSPHHPEGGIL